MGTIQEKLERLCKTKSEIKKAIEYKEVPVPDDAPFRLYPDFIKQIKSGGGDVNCLIFESIEAMEASKPPEEDTWAIVYELTQDYFGGIYRYDQGAWNLIGTKSDGQLQMDCLNKTLAPIKQYEGYGVPEYYLDQVYRQILDDLPFGVDFKITTNQFGRITNYPDQENIVFYGYGQAEITDKVSLRNTTYCRTKDNLKELKNMTIELEMQLIQPSNNGYIVWAGENYGVGFGLAFEDWSHTLRLAESAWCNILDDTTVQYIMSKKCLVTIIRDYDNKRVTLYIDGELISTLEVPNIEIFYEQPICLNREGTYSPQPVDQDIYALRIYNKCLTEQEIQEHYLDFKR